MSPRGNRKRSSATEATFRGTAPGVRNAQAWLRTLVASWEAVEGGSLRTDTQIVGRELRHLLFEREIFGRRVERLCDYRGDLYRSPTLNDMFVEESGYVYLL